MCLPGGVRVPAHILFSLVPEEAIFWMRSWPSSVFSSPRVLVSSSLFLDHSWPALILLEDCDIVSDPSEEQSSIAAGWRWGWTALQEQHSRSPIAAQGFAGIRGRSRNAPFSQVLSIQRRLSEGRAEGQVAGRFTGRRLSSLVEFRKSLWAVQRRNFSEKSIAVAGRVGANVLQCCRQVLQGARLLGPPETGWLAAGRLQE